ncbi:MAG TPA: protein kinase, partial [Polyangiaceae bacterium]|nr:protein kinase [Polyangiaceae bacterium]
MVTTGVVDGLQACIAENTILAFLAGQLKESALRNVEEHLDSCESCRRVVAVACAHSSASQLRSWADVALHVGASSAALLASLRAVEEGEYQVQGELARGGMGRILLAIDRHGRPVALKVLLSHDERAVERFVREMQVTARLRHPSIITLHEAGRWSSGEPFFAMKLVEGRSLRDELRGLSSWKERVALVSRLIAVTDALAYAHDRGVIHRDLKPGNILVGAYGETVVIDWGLAKVRGAPGEGVPHSSVWSEPFATAVTQGGALGTPAYMAPEQARGEEVDERADVYGLGAILYHSLSGQPPYAGRSGRDVLAKVLREAPTPLEGRVPEVPPDLLAIVRKAMQRAPADRYPSAKEMAEDLRRFSSGQLVSAHVYSVGALLRRWLRRNRAVVVVAACLLAVGAAGAISSVRRVVDARQRAEQQRQIATAQQQAAEALVNFLIVDFRQRVASVNRLDLLSGLGAEVQKYYRDVERSGAPVGLESLANRAATFETLGNVASDQRKMDEARALFEKALDAWAQVDAQRELRADERIQYGRAWQRVGVLEHVAGNGDAALAAHRRAIELGERVPKGDLKYVDAQLLAASNERRMCETLQLRKADLLGSLEACSRARARLEPLLADHPENTELSRTLALTFQTLSDRQLMLGHLSEAAPSVRRSVALFSDSERRDPNNDQLRREHAYAFLFLAQVELARGGLDAAIGAMRSFLERHLELQRADPANRATEEDTGVGYVFDCELQRRALRLGAADASCASAVAIFREHAAREPSAQKGWKMLVWALGNQSCVWLAQGQRAAAQQVLLEANAISRRFAAPDAGGTWQEEVLLSLLALAENELALGAQAEAVAHARQGLT